MKCFVVALVVVLSVSGIVGLPCEEGWHFYQKGNKCLKVFQEDKSWHDAGSACKKHGGRLVVIPDFKTQYFVVSLMRKMTKKTWIGLNDLKKENTFEWSDGTQACDFQYWVRGEPNNLENEDCVHIWNDPMKHWNDKSCELKYPFICEKKGPGCKYKNGGCPGVCTQNGWNVKCSCKTGFVDYHGTCTDVNECSIKNGGCDQICENTVGSFQCQCYTDFVYNGKKCVLDTGDTVVG